jgi:hypothetical protein
MTKKEKKVCRVVWFDEKDRHIPVAKVKAVLVPRYFTTVRALACKRGEFSIDTSKWGRVWAKSMTAKQQAEATPPKKRPRRNDQKQQVIDWTKRKR